MPLPNNGQYLNLLQGSLRADLDFHGVNGNHWTHGWHPFPAKFPPQLPQFFIENLSVENDVVFDPMFGSGTTLVEAKRLGRRAIGCDIDPLARMITEAKLVSLNPMKALEIGYKIVESAQRCFYNDREHLEQELSQRFDKKTRAFIDYWFLHQQQLELLALLQGIEAIQQDTIRKFFKMIFSATIITKSGGVSLARDLAHTRPHKVSDKTPNSAFFEFIKRLKQNLNRYAATGLPHREQSEEQKVEIHVANANKTGIPSSSVDLIVTSPPYANNAIDYMRAHKFSLVWFGWKIEDLAKIRSRYLGHDAARNGLDRFRQLPQQCEKTLIRLAELDDKKAAALRRYFCEMSAVINEMKRVLKSGRTAIMVVGTSHLCGMNVETQKGLSAIGEDVGFDLAGIGIRRLDRDRRMMPTRWGKEQRSQIEKRMHEEYVIGLIKQ